MTTTRRFKFSQSSIAKHAVPPPAEGKAKDILYFDDRGDPPGLGLRVGRAKPDGSPPTRTWVLQLDVHGKTRRWSLPSGRYPTMGVEEAREIARQYYSKAKKGEDPVAEQRARDAQAVTLRKAVEHHVARMLTRGDQPRSIEDMRGDAERYYGRVKGGADWLDRELRSISRLDCLELHARYSLPPSEGGRGKYAANRALRMLRAVYNTATRIYDNLPSNPVVSVEFNPEERKRAPLKYETLPAFWAAIGDLKNPVRADLVRVLMLTGLRSLDCRSIRWEEVNLGTEPMAFGDVLIPPGCIHRPSPKGGTKKNFTIPLPEAVLAILRRRRDDNPRLALAGPWVFPTVGRDGKVTHVHNAEEDTLKPFGYSPHRLRDSWITASTECGVQMIHTKALCNHSLASSGDVTVGYVRPSIEALREATEKVARFLLDKAGAKAEAA
jgi:integrase